MAERTAAKWVRRYEKRESGVTDCWSRPHRLRSLILAAVVARIMVLRRCRWAGKQIALAFYRQRLRLEPDT